MSSPWDEHNYHRHRANEINELFVRYASIYSLADWVIKWRDLERRDSVAGARNWLLFLILVRI